MKEKRIDLILLISVVICICFACSYTIRSRPMVYVENRPTLYTISQKSKLGRLFRLLLQ
ncbi:hypothetical protein MM326_12380 [Alkalihalobacillus sp. LMS6]|uniref:hypothetical protein n=1 Tax=Alkalihalobacillus sp. LMS6 TaxID=2924034 RepID=UPI0020CFEB44|nr:hypothetical protein [Alkalihalobacillus sp. LMS6]UTR04925.1 hypothetical protein MM326_12380 [Alkalihalobacillus sp. LMS6]